MATAKRNRLPITDDELIDALRRGDSHTAAALYDRLITCVDGTLVRIFGRREQDHDDLVQSAFEQIIVTLVRGKFNRACGLTGWAAAITCNFGLNALRSRVRERKLLDRSQGAELAGPSAETSFDVARQVEARSELAQLSNELAAMRHERATAVLLYDVFGYELAEVALLTGVSPAAAQSRLVRGRKELHERMSKIAASSASKRVL